MRRKERTKQEKRRGKEGLPRPPPGRKDASLRSLAPLALAPGGLRRGGGGGVRDEKTGKNGSFPAHRIPNGSCLWIGME